MSYNQSRKIARVMKRKPFLSNNCGDDNMKREEYTCCPSYSAMYMPTSLERDSENVCEQAQMQCGKEKGHIDKRERSSSMADPSD